jgi:predicted transcriptional regulator
MSVKSTSKAAHRENRESGESSRKREQVLNYVAAHPGCSRNDIARNVSGMTINCACGRVNELIAAGTLTENGCKHDSITGRSVNRLYVSMEAAA